MEKPNLNYPVKVFLTENGIRLWMCGGTFDEYVEWHRCHNLHPSLFDIVTSKIPIGVKIRGINYTLKDLPAGRTSWRETCVTKSDVFTKFGSSPSFSCPICKKSVSFFEQEAFNCCAREKIALVLKSEEAYCDDLSNQLKMHYYPEAKMKLLRALEGVDAKEITGIDLSYSLESEKS